MRPSVTRERYFQYVRARRSRYIGVQIASSCSSGMVTSAAWTERTAPERSIVVFFSGEVMRALATRRSSTRLSRLIAGR